MAHNCDRRSRRGRGLVAEISLDLIAGTSLRGVGILADFLQRTPLAQQVPASVEFHLDRLQPLQLTVGGNLVALAATAQFVLLLDQGPDRGGGPIAAAWPDCKAGVLHTTFVDG